MTYSQNQNTASMEQNSYWNFFINQSFIDLLLLLLSWGHISLGMDGEISCILKSFEIVLKYLCCQLDAYMVMSLYFILLSVLKD